MTIKFIFAKFIELILKLCIIIFFGISTLIFYSFILRIGFSFNIDYWKTSECASEGGGWYREKRVCSLWLDIDD